MRIPGWERGNFRLNKGNIFPSRKSLVSDIPAREGKTANLYYGVAIEGYFHLELVVFLLKAYFRNFAWGLYGDVDVKWSVGMLVLELH